MWASCSAGVTTPQNTFGCWCIWDAKKQDPDLGCIPQTWRTSFLGWSCSFLFTSVWEKIPQNTFGPCADAHPIMPTGTSPSLHNTSSSKEVLCKTPHQRPICFLACLAGQLRYDGLFWLLFSPLYNDGCDALSLGKACRSNKQPHGQLPHIAALHLRALCNYRGCHLQRPQLVTNSGEIRHVDGRNAVSLNQNSIEAGSHELWMMKTGMQDSERIEVLVHALIPNWSRSLIVVNVVSETQRRPNWPVWTDVHIGQLTVQRG